MTSVLDKCVRMSGSDIIAINNKWVPIKGAETFIYLNKYTTTSPAIQRTQFPLTLFTKCRV